MSEIPMKLVVDLSKPEGEREKLVPLTPEEISERELIAAQVEQERIAQEAEAQRIADLKSSAKAKLIAGEPLTEEEASVLVI